MEPIDLVNVVARWMHILAAMTAVGGTIFMRVALLPTSEELGDADRQKLHQGVRSRWAKWVHGSIGFLLLSGLYNIAQYERLYKLGMAYHILLLLKLFLALGIFFIASMLVGRSPAAERFRADRRRWLTLNMTLAILLVCVSGVMRALPHPVKVREAVPAMAVAPAEAP